VVVGAAIGIIVAWVIFSSNRRIQAIYAMQATSLRAGHSAAIIATFV